MMQAPTTFALTCALGCAALTLGCEQGLKDIGSELGGESETADSGGTADSSGTEEGMEGGTQSSGDEMLPAQGIEIIEIEANQGVGIALTSGVDWVGPGDRNSRLVGERDTLIRVHWTVADGWVEHPVTARLRLTPGEIIAEQTVVISGDSQRGSLAESINFILDASEGYADPGTQFEIELLEQSEDQVEGLAELGSHAPAGGPALIGFEDLPMEFEVVFVPIHYTADGFDTTPDITPENIAPLIDRLYEMNPVQSIAWSIHEPVEVANNIGTLGELIPVLQGVRSDDGADPNVYYSGLLDPNCVSEPCSLNGNTGIGLLPGAEKSDALSRISISAFSSVQSVAEFMPHELGHSQGLAHVSCPGVDAAGADAEYPHAEGVIGVWGYGVRSNALYDPESTSSFMSYCSPGWVSDWEWNKVFERVETLTSWNFE